ncbi:hypothetical protein [Advenella sp. FME57]|uniref:hypothetical protein n=1 Tax=Advenella sp. FME57 TaxID=2742604 RepID=UPI0018683D2B|nr:hypothetical protein [Advenella sp. FME57]
MGKNGKVLYFLFGVAVAMVINILFINNHSDFEDRLIALFTAIGTVGAVVVALYFSFSADRREQDRIDTEKRVANFYLVTQLNHIRNYARGFLEKLHMANDDAEEAVKFNNGLFPLYKRLNLLLIPSDLGPHLKSIPEELHIQLIDLEVKKSLWSDLISIYLKSKLNGDIDDAAKFAKQVHDVCETAMKLLSEADAGRKRSYDT